MKIAAKDHYDKPEVKLVLIKILKKGMQVFFGFSVPT